MRLQATKAATAALQAAGLAVARHKVQLDTAMAALQAAESAVAWHKVQLDTAQAVSGAICSADWSALPAQSCTRACAQSRLILEYSQSEQYGHRKPGARIGKAPLGIAAASQVQH